MKRKERRVPGEEIAKVEMTITDREARTRPKRPPPGSPGVEAAGDGGPSSIQGDGMV